MTQRGAVRCVAGIRRQVGLRAIQIRPHLAGHFGFHHRDVTGNDVRELIFIGVPAGFRTW